MILHIRLTLLMTTLVLSVGCETDAEKAADQLESFHAKIERDASIEGNPVVAVDLSNATFTSGDLISLQHLPHVHTVTLEPTQLDSDALRAFAEANHLHTLWIAEGFDDKRPDSPQDVSSLDLRGTKVDGKGLRHLASLTSLRGLHLDPEQLDDDALKSLTDIRFEDDLAQRGIDYLTMLDAVSFDDFLVGGTTITHAGFPCLRLLDARTISAESIDLGGAFEEFGESPPRRLAILALRNCELTNDDVAQIGKISSLETLDLKGNREVTDDGLRHLSELPLLWALNVSSTDVTDAGIEHLAGIDELRYVLLDDTAVTDELIQRWREEHPNVLVLRRSDFVE